MRFAWEQAGLPGLVRRSGADLLVHHGAHWLTVAGHFADAPVERIVFADGAIVERQASVAGVERGTGWSGIHHFGSIAIAWSRCVSARV